jgi:hypothetical protein
LSWQFGEVAIVERLRALTSTMSIADIVLHKVKRAKEFNPHSHSFNDVPGQSIFVPDSDTATDESLRAVALGRTENAAFSARARRVGTPGKSNTTSSKR